MSGPAWLADIFAGVMITVAVYCTSRLVVARWWRRPTDVESGTGAHVVMGVAMAGMLVAGLRFGPAGLWETVFAAAAAWFGWRSVRVRRGTPPDPVALPELGPHLVECGAMLYMYLALPAVAVAAKSGEGGEGGEGGMGGLGGISAAGSRFSVLSWCSPWSTPGYAVRVGDRLTMQGPCSGRDCAGRDCAGRDWRWPDLSCREPARRIRRAPGRITTGRRPRPPPCPAAAPGPGRGVDSRLPGAPRCARSRRGSPWATC